MKFLRSEKKKVATKSNSEGSVKWLPLPTPPPDHRTCNEPESYSSPVETSVPPMYMLPSLKQQELRATSSQTGERTAKVQLGGDSRQEEKKAAVVGRPWRLVECESSPRHASTSAHGQRSQSPFSNVRGSAPGMDRSANRSVTPTNRSVATFVRAPECLAAELGYGGAEVGSPSSLDWAERLSPGKASPIRECLTPQRSPRKSFASNQGKSLAAPHESFQKACKLPSPPRTPHQLDRRPHTCLSRTTNGLHDLASRPRSLPSPNHNWESSPRPYKLTPPSSPRQPAASCLQKLTPPSSPRSSKAKPVENPDYMQLSPRNSPQRSIISALPGSTSPLPRFLPQVPKPPKRWKRGAKIGSGSFGSVYEGWNLDDGTFFAVKVSNGDRICPEIHQEVAVLSKLRHPNIVQYYGTTTENGSTCIFLELVKMGSLQSIMNNFQVFDESLMSSYTRQILTGLEYLHSMNTIHRDIKCANILVDSDGQVKLADFGLAKQMEDSLATSVKGSPYYMAPEVLSPGRNKQPYGLEVDIWSLGCTVLEMAEGKPPWSGLQGYAFFFKVTSGELPPIPEHLSDTAKDFIMKCLRNNPKDRPTVKELLVHPFVAHAPRIFRAYVPTRD